MFEDSQSSQSLSRTNKTTKTVFQKWIKTETAALLILLGLVVLIWAPRFSGPIDLRWDGGVYYILGTSLAEGKGYKLLNEPGEIDAVQYPPLLPAIVAAHQLILRTDDPTIVGKWLRLSAFITFLIYIYVTFIFFKNYLSLRYSFLATLLCLFTFQVYYLSDLLFPEILFSLLTLLFILCAKTEKNRINSVLAYLFAVLSYTLRTVGIAALAAWVLESFIRKQFKQALWRAFLVLLPIACWQFYIATVESSPAYAQPAYAYQRAPYMFNNVSYARNVALRDPFAPEKGDISTAKMARRFVRNAIEIPASLGETLTLSPGYLIMWFVNPFDNLLMRFVISWIIFILIYAIGFLVFGGLTIQLFQREWIVPLYLLLYISALCFTPFHVQYQRYLMPITPLLVLSLIVFLSSIFNSTGQLISVRSKNFVNYLVIAIFSWALLSKIIMFTIVYGQNLNQVSYLDLNNQQVKYQLFFYDESDREYDLSIDYIRQQAKPDEILASGAPHWTYLRTKLKTVMPPLEIDAAKAQQLLDSVPVSYFIVGKDVIGLERYTMPIVQQFPDRWKQVYITPGGRWIVYRREHQ